MTFRQADSRFIASQGFLNRPVSSTLTIDAQLLRGWRSRRKGCMKTTQDAGTHFGVRIRQTVEKTSRPKSTKGSCV